VTQAVARQGSSAQYAEPDAATPLDLGQGPLRATGNPLDIAVSGPSFLTVQTPQGPAYTRNGQLTLASDGTLLAAGQPVSRAGGGVVKLPAGPITIALDGTIDVDGTPAANLALAHPARVTLSPLGGSLYRPADGSTLPASSGSASQIHQGYLEGSASSDVAEMVALSSVTRSYESAMKSVQTIDENEDRAIQAFTLQA
jgi:flagellar basal body rod protein FlgG